MSDMSDMSLSDLLSRRESAREAFAAAQTAVAMGIACRIDEASAILRECYDTMVSIGYDDTRDTCDLYKVLANLRALSRYLAGDESEVDDADD